MTDEIAAVEAAEPAIVETVDAPVAETEATAPEKNIDSDLLAVWHKHNPVRGADGKFAPKEPDEAAPEADTQNLTAQPNEKPVEPETPAIDAPNSWAAEYKAKWGNVPPELREYVAKREAEAHQAITRSGEQLKSIEQQVKAYEPIDQLFQSYRDEFVRRGVSPAQAVATLFAAQRTLDANPVNGLVQIAASYGIDLRPALQGMPATSTGANPLVNQLMGKIQQLENSISATAAKMTEAERIQMEAMRQQEETQSAELSKVITDFSKDKPYFEELRPLMASLVKEGHAQKLDDAYAMASSAHPEISKRIQADQRKSEEDKRQAQLKKDAEAARKSAAVNVRSVPAGASPKTMDDTLREIARRSYG